ncbi:MAG: hypothetical protein ACFCBW_00150 [Candidatus Competibacterales bacterium]
MSGLDLAIGNSDFLTIGGVRPSLDLDAYLQSQMADFRNQVEESLGAELGRGDEHGFLGLNQDFADAARSMMVAVAHGVDDNRAVGNEFGDSIANFFADAPLGATAPSGLGASSGVDERLAQLRESGLLAAEESGDVDAPAMAESTPEASPENVVYLPGGQAIVLSRGML